MLQVRKYSKIVLFTLLGSIALTVHATTPAKGVFTVADGKTVQFAKANESGLKQWSYAYDWREEQKNAEGHDGWYVLSHEEWTYLLVTPDGEGMSKNSEATVDGKKGIIILPDHWVKPVGVPDYSAPYSETGYGANVYTAAQWDLMEKSGAMFLPCQGYSTDGSSVINPTIHGRYWASDDNSTNGYTMSFDDGYIHDQNTSTKSYYYSVILVKEVTTPTILDEDDESAVFATKLAAADDYNFAYMQRTLNKDGTLYTLCLPFDVPDVDASPLAKAEVFTFEGGTVSGATGSETLHLILSRLSGKKLTQGVPYLIRWTNTGESISYLYFYNVENWDTDTNAAADGGDETIKIHGFYYKTHITGSASSSEAHYNFFLGANNTIYWPNDGETPSAKMKGFRAHFYTASGSPSSAPIRRDMQTVWDIVGAFGATTGVEEVTGCGLPVTEKLLRNGQIILVIDGKEYDLQGHQIK